MNKKLMAVFSFIFIFYSLQIYTKPLNYKPIVFLDAYRIMYYEGRLEYKNSIDTGNTTDNYYQNRLDKIKKISELIAKELGACGVANYHEYDLYIDPKYDITQRVIDHLNEEYLKSINNCPTCKQLINQASN